MTNNLLSLAVERYACIILEIGLSLLIVWNFREGLPNGSILFNIMLTLIGIACLVVVSEWLIKDDIKGATPLVLYSDGIRVKRFLLEKLFGHIEFINTSQIKEVQVVRGMSVQGNKWSFTAFGTWYEAPIELKIVVVNARVYRSGTKLPIEVMNIVERMRSNWSVPIIDHGQGIGRFEPERNNFNSKSERNSLNVSTAITSMLTTILILRSFR